MDDTGYNYFDDLRLSCFSTTKVFEILDILKIFREALFLSLVWEWSVANVLTEKLGRYWCRSFNQKVKLANKVSKLKLYNGSTDDLVFKKYKQFPIISLEVIEQVDPIILQKCFDLLNQRHINIINSLSWIY